MHLYKPWGDGHGYCGNGFIWYTDWEDGGDGSGAINAGKSVQSLGEDWKQAQREYQ